jgi:hypothetical protein
MGGSRRKTSGLAPGALGQDQPNADFVDAEFNEPISNEVTSALFVVEPTLEQLGPNLNDDPKVAEVEEVSRMKPNIDVPGFRRTDAGLLWTRDSLGDEVG